MPSNPQFLAGQRLTATNLQQLGLLDSYSPTITATTTSPTLGTGPIQNGWSLRSANNVQLWIYIQFGTSPTAGSGTYRISLPVNYGFGATILGGPIGTVWLNDNSAGTVRLGVALADVASNTIWMRTTSNDALVTNAAPWTWAANDVIAVHASYLID